MWYKNYIKRKYDWVRRNPILSSYIGFVKGIIFTLIICFLLSSCGVYNIQTRYRQPEIKSVLAITSQGDTIQVPINDIRRQMDVNPGTYSNWRFYWNNSWYWGSGWYGLYDPYWYSRYGIYRYNPYRVNPRIRIPQKVEVPRRYRTPNRVQSATPRSSNTPRVQPNRGRSNQPTRTPQYNTPRTRTTPNVIQRPSRTRSNSSVKQGNN